MKKIGEKKVYSRVRADTGQHRRILVVAAVLGILAFIPAALQLYNLMIINYDYYADLALRNQTRTTRVMAERGLIYDRNMNLLAKSSTAWTVYITPNGIKSIDDAGQAVNCIPVAEISKGMAALSAYNHPITMGTHRIGHNRTQIGTVQGDQFTNPGAVNIHDAPASL